MGPHDPFKALGPIDWATASASSADLFSSALADAHRLVATVPGSSQVANADPKLAREWKEVVRPAGNPHGISMHRVSARDRGGTWFARRSVVRGVGFDRFKAGLENEFEETLRRVEAGAAQAGTGNIRGVGAERRVERREVDGFGLMRVYYLSVRFPGPTTPRDFVTLLLSSSEDMSQGGEGARRQFTLVSKPCIHPDCPQREGFIRGKYESVEIIREIPMSKPLRQARSSIDLGGRGGKDNTRDGRGPQGPAPSIRSPNRTDSESEEGSPRPASFSGLSPGRGKELGNEGDAGMAIEWIMITRSDPGGSIPRFLVDKNTPPGIITDAGRFLDWLSDKQSDVGTQEYPENDGQTLPEGRESVKTDSGLSLTQPEAQNTGSSGIFSMIASALEAAASAMISSLHPEPDGGTESTKDEDDASSSEVSFASAEERAPSVTVPDSVDGELASSSRSAVSALSGSSQTPSVAARRHEKALRKLEERRRKTQEKLSQAQERVSLRRREDREKDAQQEERRREKHEKELARQEKKYLDEVRKLEERRLADERKAEQRQRKAAEREERADLKLQLDRARADRDAALKEAEILRAQVGDLQAQNTLLVARLGKMGGLADAEGSLDSLQKEAGEETKG